MPPISAAERATEQQNSFDAARSNLYTTIGTTSDTISHDTIQALPLGTNQPVEFWIRISSTKIRENAGMTMPGMTSRKACGSMTSAIMRQ